MWENGKTNAARAEDVQALPKLVSTLSCNNEVTKMYACQLFSLCVRGDADNQRELYALEQQSFWPIFSDHRLQSKDTAKYCANAMADLASLAGPRRFFEKWELKIFVDLCAACQSEHLKRSAAEALAAYRTIHL